MTTRRTPVQRLALEALDRWYRREGVPATVQEVADETRRGDDGWLRYDPAYSALTALVRKGLVKRTQVRPAHYTPTEDGRKALETPR